MNKIELDIDKSFIVKHLELFHEITVDGITRVRPICPHCKRKLESQQNNLKCSTEGCARNLEESADAIKHFCNEDYFDWPAEYSEEKIDDKTIARVRKLTIGVPICKSCNSRTLRLTGTFSKKAEAYASYGRVSWKCACNRYYPVTKATNNETELELCRGWKKFGASDDKKILSLKNNDFIVEKKSTPSFSAW